MREVHAIWRGPFRAYFHRRFTRAYSVNKKSRTVHAFFMHIGNHIKQIFSEQGRKVSWLATRLCCDRRNIYKIFQRESIDTALLAKISALLNHNFLQDLADEIREDKGNLL